MLATRTANNRDRDRKGRHRRPLAAPNTVDGHSTLTVEEVRAIRADPRPQPAIAADYGMSQSNVAKIKLRQTHRQIE